jgi:hypothetical protein
MNTYMLHINKRFYGEFWSRAGALAHVQALLTKGLFGTGILRVQVTEVPMEEYS